MAALASAAFADSAPQTGSRAGSASIDARPPGALAQRTFRASSIPRSVRPSASSPHRSSAPTLRRRASADKTPGPWGFLDLKGQNLLGDMGGLRPALDKYGVQLTILENVETFGNVSGGVKQGFETDGLTTVTLQMDTEKAFGLKGGTLNVSGLQYWGGNLTANNLLVLQTLSDIEAPVGGSTLGAVVSAEIWRQIRRQGRRAEPRRGIHHQPERQLPLHQWRFRFPGAAGRGFARPAAPPIRWQAWAFAEERS